MPNATMPSLEEIIAFRASGAFDEAWYLTEYPDVAKSAIDPAEHYLGLGRRLGRPARPPAPTPSDTAKSVVIERQARYRVDRTALVLPGEDWLVFVAYSGNGSLSDCQRYQIECFAAAGYAVALVVNTDAMGDMVEPRCGAARIVIVRENLGYDFGAWRHAIELLGGLTDARSISFTNDSIVAVPDEGASGGIRQLREQINSVPCDVIFLTRNQEVRPHCQSFFFTLRAEALARGALDHIAAVPLYREKEHLIYEVEVHFSDLLQKAGMVVRHLYHLDVQENPTIHHWETLLDNGFPFIKVQLITAGILNVDDDRLVERLGPDVHPMLKAHVGLRTALPAPSAPCAPAGPRPSLQIKGMFNEYGAQQAANPAPSLFPTIQVPLSGGLSVPSRLPKILAIIHGFYTDLLPQMLEQIASLGIDVRLLVTTDTSTKVGIADELIANAGLTGHAVLCQNRGRDVAPFLIEGAKYLDDAEIILHLHTKKSPHDSIYSGWGEFLRANLIGSREVALSILRLFDQKAVGLVYSDHFPPVNDLRNWGFDFDHAAGLLSRIGCDISADTPLEFPTSTMFWARREAIEPLFRLGLDYEDFEPEAGQIDGTLAHAIERSLLYVCEHKGFAHVKVTTLNAPTDPDAALMRLQADSVPYALNRPMPRLNGGLTLRSKFYDSVAEIYPVGVASSSNRRLRLNAILPTMKPEKIYGGITMALAVIRQIADQMGSDVDLRVLITSDTVDRPSVEAITSRLGRPFIQANPQDDTAGNTIVGIAEAQHLPISMRPREMYIATAWWTADLGFRLLDQQRSLFGANPLMAYIIQDFEPGFYNWSNHYALADATYRRPDETLAILNSEELAGYMQARYKFYENQYVAYELHPVLNSLITPTRPEKLILAYGRPTVNRNCFELLCEGLRVWQARNPRVNSAFEIIFAGEEFDEGRLADLENARTVGKMTIEEYAGMLNRACAGVSLMVSPHPSYPPLEMASAGCVTVTNSYEGKDLTRRSDRFISLDAMTPQALADALDQAIRRVDFAAPKPVRGVTDLAIDMPPVDYAKVSSMMLSRALLT
jgi:lipopolysaccharide biosynthesis protein